MKLKIKYSFLYRECKHFEKDFLNEIKEKTNKLIKNGITVFDFLQTVNFY